MPELSLDHDQRDSLAGHLDRVRMPKLVVVPTSAQTPLSRPVRCADMCRKFLLSSNETSESVGIFRSLQDEHERVTDAIGALASRAEQVGAVDRQRLPGHVGGTAIRWLPRFARCSS